MLIYIYIIYFFLCDFKRLEESEICWTLTSVHYISRRRKQSYLLVHVAEKMSPILEI